MRNFILSIVALLALASIITLQACKADDIKKAADAEVRFATEVNELQIGLNAALERFPPDATEDNAMLAALVKLLPAKVQVQVASVIEQAVDARAALNKLNEVYLPRWSNNAFIESQELYQKYAEVKDKEDRSFQNFTTIATSILSVVTGGAWFGTRRVAQTNRTAFEDVTRGVERFKNDVPSDVWNSVIAPRLTESQTNAKTQQMIEQVISRLREEADT